MVKKNVDDWKYPILFESLDELFEKIVKSSKASECLTFWFKPMLGGSRSWFKFLIKNKESFSLNKIDSKTRFVTFEPTECFDNSSLSFFYGLLKAISEKNNIPDYDKISLQQVMKLIFNKIEDSKTKITILILKLDEFLSLNSTIGNLLYSVWKDNKDKLNFVSTFSRGLSELELKDKFGSFQEAIFQNFFKIEAVSDDDIRQSIVHWSHKLNCEYPLTAINSIVKHSSGSPYLSKLMCQKLSKHEYKLNIVDKYCADIKNYYISQLLNSKLSIKINSNLVLLDGRDISSEFSYQEFGVLKLMVEHVGSLVNRDDIADTLWGNKSFEKYSDWAIDKFVSLIRKKLRNLNFIGEIKVKKGEGFTLIEGGK